MLTNSTSHEQVFIAQSLWPVAQTNFPLVGSKLTEYCWEEGSQLAAVSMTMHLAQRNQRWHLRSTLSTGCPRRYLAKSLKKNVRNFPFKDFVEWFKRVNRENSILNLLQSNVKLSYSHLSYISSNTSKWVLIIKEN